MTWMTPFDAMTFGLRHLRAADEDLPAGDPDPERWPSSVLTDVSLEACAAVTLPVTTW